jgi:hypothetical protein
MHTSPLKHVCTQSCLLVTEQSSRPEGSPSSPQSLAHFTNAALWQIHDSGQLSMQKTSAAQAAVQASGSVEDWGRAVTLQTRRRTRRDRDCILLVCLRGVLSSVGSCRL